MAVYAVAIMQRAAGYFHAAEASVARIAHYLIHSCAELLGILRADGVFFYKFNKLTHALELKPRAVQHREELSFKYEPRNIAVSDILPGRKLFKKLLIAHGNALARFLRVIRKVKAALREPLAQIGENPLPVAARKIHFRCENDRRHIVPVKQPPECFRVRLDAVGAGYDEQRIVNNVERALRFRREVGMSGRVKKTQLHTARMELRLF